MTTLREIPPGQGETIHLNIVDDFRILTQLILFMGESEIKTLQINSLFILSASTLSHLIRLLLHRTLIVSSAQHALQIWIPRPLKISLYILLLSTLKVLTDCRFFPGKPMVDLINSDNPARF